MMAAPEAEDAKRAASQLTRRQFLVRAAASVAAAGASSSATAYLLGRSPSPGPSVELPAFADYSTPGSPDAVATAQRADGAAAVRAGVDALGGMSRFVKPGEAVFIKPNVGFDRPPWVGATTTPEVVAEVVRLCRQAGAATVLVGDYSINDPAGCFATSGIGPAVRRAGGRILLPREADFEPVHIGGKRLGAWKAYYRPFRAYNVQRVIGLPTAKQHARSGISGAMKNWYGLLGGPRSVLHQDIDTVLVDLCRMMPASLIVMDATRLLVRNGPTGGSRGDVKQANRVIAGPDPVAIDTLTAEWLGQDPAGIAWLRRAQQASLGTMDYQAKLREA